LVRLMAVALAVTVATAAAIHALHERASPPWVQNIGGLWV
jgi:hypothetical protein